MEMSPVQVKPAGDHIAREKNIRKAVVIEIADANPAAVIDVDDIQRVQGITFRNRVVECDTGLRSRDLEK
jgi:kynurenine formamidase